MNGHAVALTVEAQHDLERLFDHLLASDLARDGGDLDLAAQALASISGALTLLQRYPFTCRKASGSPFLRELVIPFASTGCVALFDILDSTHVLVLAVRHQREDDYH